MIDEKLREIRKCRFVDGIFIPEDTTILPVPIGAFTEFPPILEDNTNEDSTDSFVTEMTFPWEITEEGTDDDGHRM